MRLWTRKDADYWIDKREMDLQQLWAQKVITDTERENLLKKVYQIAKEKSGEDFSGRMGGDKK